MRSWLALAAEVVALEAVLARRGRPLLSHDAWTACDTRQGRAVVTGGCATLVAHLRWRQDWPHALAIGAVAGLIDLAFPHGRSRSVPG